MNLVLVRERIQNSKLRKVTIFDLDILPGGRVRGEQSYDFVMFGYSKGLFCLLKLEFGLYNLFVINPILGEFIQLPDPVVDRNDKKSFLSYGIGFCEFSNRYKVLRIFRTWIRRCDYRNSTEIFTLGSDRNWRTVADVSVPYNMQMLLTSTSMVNHNSALHWMVQPLSLSKHIKLVPKWGTGKYICAFDMTEEKATAIQLPQGVVHDSCYQDFISVMFNKLCLWHIGTLFSSDRESWVIDEYGVEVSWTKLFVFRANEVPRFKRASVRLLALSPEGVILLSDCRQVVFYDLKKAECLMVVDETKEYCFPFPFVPTFVSLRNLDKVGEDVKL